MRPLRLQVKGFTSFRDPCEIDLAGLDLLAIVGPTGSGKSSLLDAMTYALYGQAERVGNQIGQLVSQGQRRCAVTLEFAVGDARYRVTRSTPAATGQTKILLERHDGTDFAQAGEGADRVREVNAMIERAVGLDYRAFTRSVLLPQGRFSEFLVGEAKERRKILTELLGLELFERLARRAGEIRKRATIEADTKEEVLATQFAGATPEAAADAEAAATAAAELEERLADAEREVAEAAERGAEAERVAVDLRSCAEDARELEVAARGTADALGELAEQVGDADRALEATERELADATEGAERAVAERSAAEAEWGTEADLVAMRGRLESLARRRVDLELAGERLAEAERSLPEQRDTLAAATAAVARATAGCQAAEEDARAAREAADRAQHADLVAAVRAGVRRGDPCPICGGTIETIHEDGAAGTDLAGARRALEEAERAAKGAAGDLRKAERARDVAATELETAEADAAKQRDAVRTERSTLELEEREIAAALREEGDPLAALEGRIGRLRSLAEEERAAVERASSLQRTHREAERARDRLAARVAEERARLAGRPAAALLKRSAKLGGEDLPLPALAVAELPEGASDAAESAVTIADEARSLAAELEASAERHHATIAELLAGAERAVEGADVERPGTLEGLGAATAAAARQAAVTAGTLAKEADEARERLAAARELSEEVAASRVRAERFGALALELRADRVMEFLQLEALQLLAADGSERLRLLSEGRYRLIYEGDEFFVVDTWNGEERRSARTLSGGETFLASLALALALSEQVRSLAVTDKAPLESLFLDEGFGTLDPETLEVVIGAIEQLGGNGRMVGVVTHVLELAIRLPVRIEVEKSPRGSRLRVVA